MMTSGRLVMVFFLLSVLRLSKGQFKDTTPCFCKTSDEGVEDCECDGDSVDLFNNHRIFPLLQALLQKSFFRFYKVNMERECPFWTEDRACASRECGIEHCDDQVPDALRRPSSVSVVRLANGSVHLVKQAVTRDGNGDDQCVKQDEQSNQFDPLDKTLTEVARKQLRKMDVFEESEHKFCDVDDEDSNTMHYVDLSRNPERYTGYKGDSAQKVWKCIYQENCFKPNPKFDKNFLLHPTATGFLISCVCLSLQTALTRIVHFTQRFSGLCLEKRVFYRLISGLHSAITVSVAAHNYKPAPAGFGTGTWFRNVDMFRNRFGTAWSSEGPERMKNIYFVYLLELRAILKAAPYLKNELFYTGDEKEDLETREAIDQLLSVCQSFPHHFDETKLFTGVEASARELREEFRQHFMNISRIMDCVGCDKCRLWGKLQTHGMGTALKILFSDLPNSHFRSTQIYHAPFQLTRNEVVALLQSFGRYASSIREIAEFRTVMAS